MTTAGGVGAGAGAADTSLTSGTGGGRGASSHAMHPQLAAIADEFRSAQGRLHRLRDTLPAERWSERPDPRRWSVAECVTHLNITSEKFRPGVEAALAQGRAAGGPPWSGTYRRDPVGWFLWKMLPPPARIRFPTRPDFIPQATATAAELVTTFDRLQEEQLSWVGRADGLPLGELRVKSPFDPSSRITYNLFACLSILPVHQHRHLWQAERVRDALAKS